MPQALNISAPGDSTTKFLTDSLFIRWFTVCLQRPAQLWDQRGVTKGSRYPSNPQKTPLTVLGRNMSVSG